MLICKKCCKKYHISFPDEGKEKGICNACGKQSIIKMITNTDWERIAKNKKHRIDIMRDYNNNKEFLRIIVGNKVIAVRGKNRGVAKCHPIDTEKDLYDVNIGTELAANRMNNKIFDKKIRHLTKQRNDLWLETKQLDNLRLKITKKLNSTTKKTLALESEYKLSLANKQKLLEMINERCKIESEENK